MADETVLRLRGGQVVGGIILVASLVGLVLPGVAWLSEDQAGFGVAGLAVGAAFVWLAIRLIRAAVVIRDDGLLVRNYLRSHWLGWDDIAAILPPSDGPFSRAVRIERADGQTINCRSLAPGTGQPGSKVDPQLRQLRRALQRRGGRQQQRPKR